jgi:hypothetical protein
VFSPRGVDDAPMKLFDPNALLKQMAWEMYAVARPGQPVPANTEMAARQMP